MEATGSKEDRAVPTSAVTRETPAWEQETVLADQSA